MKHKNVVSEFQVICRVWSRSDHAVCPRQGMSWVPESQDKSLIWHQIYLGAIFSLSRLSRPFNYANLGTPFSQIWALFTAAHQKLVLAWFSKTLLELAPDCFLNLKITTVRTSDVNLGYLGAYWGAKNALGVGHLPLKKFSLYFIRCSVPRLLEDQFILVLPLPTQISNFSDHVCYLTKSTGWPCRWMGWL
jgi:hypothetical protein